jgi:hypothetical protein
MSIKIASIDMRPKAFEKVVQRMTDTRLDVYDPKTIRFYTKDPMLSVILVNVELKGMSWRSM